ncbi:MAG: histidinol-phosphate aminotransferase [Parasphingorhabdus sp.]
MSNSNKVSGVVSGPRYTPLVESLPSTVPFVGPETQERNTGILFDARLGANESVFGPSPKVVEAVNQYAGDIWKYGDPENYDLKAALAKHHGIQAENIVVGEGIDGLFGYLARLLISNGVPVVTSLGAYPTFNFHVNGFGGVIHTVPFNDDREDIEALLAKTLELDAPLTYLANPDNPMGSWNSKQAVQSLIDRMPESSLLCLDEAYIELSRKDIAPVIDVTNPRVIRFRTFSKAYGMAGARIGYAIAEAGLATAFNKIRNHFGVTKLSQVAALAALGDQGYLESVRRQVWQACERIAEIAADNDLVALPTATNFVAIDCGRDGDFARSVVTELGALGVFVRMPFVVPQNRCIRVSAGGKAELDVLAERLPKALMRARGKST